jgi:hypothetical protein
MRRRTGQCLVSFAVLGALSACGSTVRLQSTARGSTGSTVVAQDQAGPLESPAAAGNSSVAAGGGTPASVAAAPSTGAAQNPASAQPSTAATRAGTTKGSATAGSPAPRRTVSTSASAQPIQIGLLSARNQSTLAASFGVSTGATVTNDSVQDALVDWYNAHGGMAGHKVQAVRASINATAASYETDYQAACQLFTQDNHVVAVLDNFAYISPTFEACTTQAKIVNIRGGSTFIGSDAPTTNPLLFSVGGLTVDRRLVTLVDKLATVGYLTPSNKVAVLMSGCPYNIAVYGRSLVPALARHGIKVADKREGNCTMGTTNAGPAAANASSYVLAFSQAGIDRIIFVTDQEDVGYLLFATEADQQRYYPGYALTTLATAALTTGTVPASQVKNVRGVGWGPAGDVAGDQQPPLTPTATDCLQRLKQQGMTPGSVVDRSIMTTACGSFFLLEAALRGASAPTSLGVGAAISGLGESSVGAAVLGSATSFNATRHDGPASTAVFGWAESCACLRYQTSPTTS